MSKGKSPFAIRMRDIADEIIYQSVTKKPNWQELDDIAMDLHELADSLDQMWATIMDVKAGQVA